VTGLFLTEHTAIQHTSAPPLAYDSTLYSVVFDCEGNTSAIRGLVLKRDEAVVYRSHFEESEWEFDEYPPGSIGDAETRAVCGEQQ
jgi:hypothetical protein